MNSEGGPSRGVILTAELHDGRHITIAYLGTVDSAPDPERLLRYLRGFDRPISGKFVGTRHFGPEADGSIAYVEIIESPDLVLIHEMARRKLKSLVSNKYPNYRPHATFGYYSPDNVPPEENYDIPLEFHLPGLALWYGEDRYKLVNYQWDLTSS